jgi:diadenosine tetraphosphate (Ap4A) HIT family hydrolase
VIIPSCALCDAVDESPKIERPAYNTHLLVSPHFVVIPAVGPLSLGHVMIVSRSHLPNLGSMTRVEIAEYASVVDVACARLGVARDELLEAEHGSDDDATGGACISHVHVNLIPKMARHIDMFDALLPSQPVRHDLDDLYGTNAPYILLRTSRNTRLLTAHGVPSQLIRRRLCELEGRDDWDWGAAPALELVEATVRRWNP